MRKRNALYVQSLSYMTVGLALPMVMVCHAQLLYWDQLGKIAWIALLKSTMSIMGICAFLLSHFVGRWGLKKSARLGFWLYGMGITLRLYPTHWSGVLLSGIISGLGCDLIHLVEKTQLSNLDCHHQKFLLTRCRHLRQVCRSIGPLAASGFLSYSMHYVAFPYPYVLILGFSALLTILIGPMAVAHIPQADQVEEVADRAGPSLALGKSVQFARQHLSFFLLIFPALGLEMLSAVFMANLIPLFLRDKGFSAPWVNTLLGVRSALDVLTTYVASKRISRSQAPWILLLSGIVSAGLGSGLGYLSLSSGCLYAGVYLSFTAVRSLNNWLIDWLELTLVAPHQRLNFLAAVRCLLILAELLANLALSTLRGADHAQFLSGIGVLILAYTGLFLMAVRRAPHAQDPSQAIPISKNLTAPKDDR